jgi:Ca2+/Na+ antiporter
LLTAYFEIFEYVLNIDRVSNHLLNFSVTILPLANGAGDVMTAVVASGSDEGIKIVIGSIFGASLFLTTVVLAAVIYYSKTIKVLLKQ